MSHPAPPVYRTIHSHSFLYDFAQRPCQASPHAGPSGSADSTGLRPLPPTPKRKVIPSAIERDACGFRQKISKQKMKP